VCVCVCVRERARVRERERREGKRERGGEREGVCVCVREREEESHSLLSSLCAHTSCDSAAERAAQQRTQYTNTEHSSLSKDARRSIEAAAAVVLRREGAYRVPAKRIAGWLPHDSKGAPSVTSYQVQ
jgi:hypothetical protein